jgi:hypothetical protein
MALHKILNTWGSRLTWTAQREHAAQIVSAMDSFYMRVPNSSLYWMSGRLESTGWHQGRAGTVVRALGSTQGPLESSESR